MTLWKRRLPTYTVCLILHLGLEPLVRVLTPAKGHALIRRWVPEQTTTSGIIIQDESASYGFGVIEAITPYGENAHYKIGDIVLVEKDSGTSLQWNGNVCLMIKSMHIIGVVE
jgi:co-chaperonin GroES (HSP10)